ncbi:hypothetical protein CDL15_Pgr013316 [Punica granatum]|uniref:Uncharacterized protein n=1 Tax=Punica granatum TaxID=22663 RepID=A0A218WR07_PUNGR|nr:hypothetical protein CDL15_Pgr013316 [Punica granatum]
MMWSHSSPWMNKLDHRPLRLWKFSQILTQVFSESKFDTCYMAAKDIEEINIVNSVSHVLVSVYTSKYPKPIKVIAFLDTKATQNIMNLEVLSHECWKPHTKHFSTASIEVFSTHLISKPIKIQFFPE